MSDLCKLVQGEDGVPYLKIGNEGLRLEKEDLDECLLERSRQELRESPEIVKESMVKLRELLAGEDNLKVPTNDDVFLYQFLRPCKFYPESAFKLIKRFYKFRIKFSDLCKDLLPSRERKVFAQGIVSLLPKRGKNGERIMLIESGHKWKPKLVTLNEIFKAVMISLQAAMSEPRTQVTGVSVIIDMDGLSLSHVMQFGPTFAKMVIDWVQECIPVRLKSVHIVKQPYVFNMVWAIFKPFIIEKLRKRIHFHGNDLQSLINFLGKESLSPKYDGTMIIPDYPGSLLCDLLCHYEKDYEYSNSLGYTK